MNLTIISNKMINKKHNMKTNSIKINISKKFNNNIKMIKKMNGVTLINIIIIQNIIITNKKFKIKIKIIMKFINNI
jgi:hypothetical protein